MARLLALCVAVIACIGIGSALQCLKCSFTFEGMPCHTSTTTCQDGEVCATIKGSTGGTGLIVRRNCVAEEKCHKNETESYLGIKYTTTHYCCQGDFCNSGATLPTSHLSLPMALAMLGVWLARLL